MLVIVPIEGSILIAATKNDANMIAMGQRVIGEGLAVEILNAWLHTEFEGGRHIKRIEKMMALERE